MFYVFFILFVFYNFFKRVSAFFILSILFILQILIAIILIYYVGFETLQTFSDNSISAENAIFMKFGSLLERLGFFLNNISTILYSPIGIGYPDIKDMLGFLDINLNENETSYLSGLRTPTGLIGMVIPAGGFWLLGLYFYGVYKAEVFFKRFMMYESLPYIKAGIVMISLISTSSFFSPLFAVLIGVFFKKQKMKSQTGI
jgi:hypothetical protein